MIKINLLPYRTQRRRELILQQIVLAVIPLTLTILIIGIVWYSMNSKIENIDNKIVTIEKKIKKSKLKIKDIKKFKKKKKTIAQKMEVIDKLQKGRTGPVHVLDELSTRLPGNLWLTQLTQEGMSLRISGKALDNFSISNYMVNLEQSPYFNTITLNQVKSSKTRSQDTQTIKEFDMISTISFKAKNTERKTPDTEPKT